MPEYISGVEMGIDDETIVRSAIAEIDLANMKIKRLYAVRDEAVRRMVDALGPSEVARRFNDLPNSGLSLSSIKIINRIRSSHTNS